ncbi:transglycosylase domain-containing protein [Kordiimonas aestuarii]|uniref:transglycosylase domain-containing protein n=1 Tax=Kordiimonas aestuarii TaxID=1005925 RepID=UPI0021CF911B|nr:PBP1A family penicillin-binding protein [Kordiimonas aestuarii]
MSKKPTPKKHAKKLAAKAKGPARKKLAVQSEETTAPKKPRVKRVIYGLSVASVWAFMLGLVTLAFLALDLPDLDNLPAPGAADQAVVIKAANGATLVTQGPIYGDWIRASEAPDALVRAFMAVEDRHFFEHGGIDFRGLARAVLSNVQAGRVRAGGSTITQQLAKNLFLSNERTLKRKAQELLLAFWLEQKFTKEQILTLYLNRVYFGGGAYGIDAASRKFFGHSATTLSVAESAMLAGLVKAPSSLAPHINPEGAWTRAQVVLSAMANTRALTQEAAEKIKGQPPRIIGTVSGRDVRYFTDWVLTEADRVAAGSRGKSLVIYTTLDPGVQRAAAMALERGLRNEGAKRGATQGAIVALDHDGAVRGMVGGFDYGKSQYNRAVQALRQPGSAFKLFSYLAGLEAGIEPDDKYIDHEINIDGWSPKNYTGLFSGEMEVREAFARSINTVAVQVSEQAGRERVAGMAKRLGISTPVMPLASLPLGTEEVKLLDLAGAYAAVANGGFEAHPYGIVEITTLEGQVVYRRTPMNPRAVLTHKVVEEMADMLKGAVEWGSGKNARIDRPVGGKTGTSQDSRDAVFAGFTSDMTAAVWVGNDDSTPMKGVTGGSLPARVWADFMIEAHAGAPVRPLLADSSLFMAAARDEDKHEDLKKQKKKSFLSRLFGN